MAMTKELAIQILSTRDWSGMLCGYTSGYTEALDMAIEALQAEQTAEWIQPTSSEDCRRLDIRFVRCSKCGEQQIVVGHKGYNELPFKYCPNCRAKMSLQKRVEFTRSYSCDSDDYGAMCEWCEYDDGSKCTKPTKGDDEE